jgi:hypothetical protein
VPLVLDGLKLSRTRFETVGPRGKLDRRHGSVLTLHLNRMATVSLRFERVQPGRRINGRCRLGKTRGPRCLFITNAGTVNLALPAGTSTIRLTGRIGPRALAPGSYRLTVSARSSDGRRSAVRQLSFTVLRSGSKG